MPLNFLFERNIEMKNKEGCGCIDRAYFVYVTVLAIAPDDAIRQIARSFVVWQIGIDSQRPVYLLSLIHI